MARMSQDFGREAQRAPTQIPHREPARYLVLIESGGTVVARLFVATRVQVAEFDAATEEITQMIAGLQPRLEAGAADWDQALAGHSADERRTAEVYQLDV